jgi:hypothetical protein
MRFEITSELREIIVNVTLDKSQSPVISTSRGWEFNPSTLHALWVRENAGSWEMVYVELKGTLPKSGRNVNRTFWCGIKELPEWVGEIVEATTPIEVRVAVTS